MERNQITEGKYYPQLDTVRAFAVMFVLFHHFFNRKISALLGFGNLGVDIFFTLSGFLITGILISYKSAGSITGALKKFYYRRFLRIFPIYYLYIFIILLIFREQISKTLVLYSVFYGMNFYTIHFGWDNFNLSHFWSLAVEEQFYLVWPFLIFLFQNKYLKNLIFLIILISIGFSYLYIHNIFIDYLHPFSCMQALAIGAFAKYITVFNKDIIVRNRMKIKSLILLSFLLWICSLIFYDLGKIYAFPLLRTFAAFSTGFLLINIILKSNPAWLNKILDIKPLQFIGRISYGIYVYHILVKALLDPILYDIVIKHTGEHNLLRYNLYVFTYPLYTIITIFISWISFKYLESPINKLKNRDISQNIGGQVYQ